MKKGVYFIIQLIWSFLLSSLVWYLFLKNASFDFYHNSDETLEGIFLFVGAAVYFVLTVVYMIIGYKKVQNWRAWMIPVSIVICAGCVFLGACGVVYGSEFINKLFLG